ncbi:hypothetical protein [Nocardia sp. AB354]
MLLQQLAFKFGPLPESVTGTVHAARPEEVRKWALRILTADTLAAVFDR